MAGEWETNTNRPICTKRFKSFREMSNQPELPPSPFQPLIEELGRLTQDNPEKAHHASKILRLYSTLWECHVSKVLYLQRLEEENEILRASNIQLCQEIQAMDRHHVNQEALIACYGQIFERIHAETGPIISYWNGFSDAPPSGISRNEVDGTSSSE